MDHLQSNIFIAGQRLNDLTGYSGIEALKKDIEQQESLLQTTRTILQEARTTYSDAISRRSASQREVNTLLQRKHAWTPPDLERFTALYRSDHANEQAETSAQEHLASVERQAEEASAKLSSTILARYHEEQIWSDKIRRMSTWGTWGLMGVNVVLFLVFQIGVEPWRRRRLVRGFEEKVVEALGREGNTPTTLTGTAVAADGIEDAQISAAVAEENLPKSEISLSARTEEAEVTIADAVPPSEPVSTFQRIEERLQDLFSERQIIIRRVDLTHAMIEGAAAGMAVVFMFAFFLKPPR
ncbi:sensitivity to high expression protein she9 [Lecanora helva]